YYSKGPLVAWLIRAGCLTFGDHTWAVRLPAVVCGSLLLVAVYVLTARLLGREKVAAAAGAARAVTPPSPVGNTVLATAAPFAGRWGWALVLAHAAVFRRSAAAWPLLGAVVAVGVLAKPTMALFPLSLALFLLATPGHRPLLRGRGFWLAAAVA